MVPDSVLMSNWVDVVGLDWGAGGKPMPSETLPVVVLGFRTTRGLSEHWGGTNT